MNQEYIREYKGYQIKPHKLHPASYIVVTAGKGGKIPDVLDGLFTTRTIAQQAVDQYLETKEDNAKEGTTRGGK